MFQKFPMATGDAARSPTACESRFATPPGEPSDAFAFATKGTPWRRFALEAGMRAAGWAAVGLRLISHGADQSHVGMLTYHRIAPHVRGLPKPLHNVTPDRFREQLTGLMARRFDFWPLRKVLAYYRQGRAIPPRTAVVTFDDGFQTVYTRAWPVLRELNIPATVFVNTAYLDGNAPFPFDAWGVAHREFAPSESYRPLTTPQCREMADQGLIDLGAHTHTHEDFRNRPDDFLEDMKTSIGILQSRFGLDDPTFAFPFGTKHAGFASEELTAIARQCGVLCALTTEPVLVDPASDPFGWGRFNAFCWDTSATLAAKLEGWYSWAPKLRQWISRTIRRAGVGSHTQRPSISDHPNRPALHTGASS